MPLVCGHDAPASVVPVCAHIRPESTPWLSTYTWYTGTGMSMELLCARCTGRRDEGSVIAVDSTCVGCFHQLATGVISQAGVRGSPEVRQRLVPVREPVATQAVAGLTSPLVDLAPATDAGRWFGLCADGTVVSLAADWSVATPVTSVELPLAADREPWMGHQPRLRLHASPTGRFLAVVVDFGQVGVVVDVTRQAVTMRLDNGGGHEETVPFPVSFTSLGGREVLVHQTAWNRLDLSDPADGALLTDRGPTAYASGEARPARYLDYFHGRLTLSPDGRRAVDDGWVWHPVGVPVVWDLDRWLHLDAWESEDGPSRRSLGARSYYWNHGICWLDDDRVAVEGIGDDDDEMIPGVIIYTAGPDATTPATMARPPAEIGSIWTAAPELSAFAGPAGTLFGADDLLFSVATEGTSIWTVEDGTRIGIVPGFAPAYQDRRAGLLIELNADHVRTWRYAALQARRSEQNDVP